MRAPDPARTERGDKEDRPTIMTVVSTDFVEPTARVVLAHIFNSVLPGAPPALVREIDRVLSGGKAPCGSDRLCSRREGAAAGVNGALHGANARGFASDPATVSPLKSPA